MAKPREMTGSERATLKKLIAADGRVNWKMHVGMFVLALTALPALYSVLVLFVLAILARIAGFPIGDGGWRDNPVTYFGAIAAVVVIWTLVVASEIRWAVGWERSRKARQAKLESDLARGVVRDEVLSVTGIKLLREPEHSMILCFLQLSNDRCFVLYDYDSVDTEDKYGGNGPPTLVPCENFHLVTFPLSKARSWSFSGKAVPLPAILSLELGPEDWPEDESWSRVKWENIERHYGPKRKPRQTAASKRS